MARQVLPGQLGTARLALTCALAAALGAVGSTQQGAAQGAVSGRVLDENGRPMPAVMVNLFGYDPVTGERSNGGSDRTDDRGGYHVLVPPGRYIAMVRVAHGSRDASFTPAGRGTLIRAIGDDHRPVNLIDVDGQAELTGRAEGLIPPPRGPGGRARSYVSTFAPDARRAATARLFTVAARQEVRDADVRMQVAPSPRVAGLLAVPMEPEAIATVRLVPAGPTRWDLPPIETTTSRQSFVFVRVPAGEYVLQAERSFRRSDMGRPDPRRFAGSLPITVGETDIAALVVPMRSADGVAGELASSAGDPLAARGTAIVRGAVVDARAQPIERALVGLASLDSQFMRTAVTDVDGRFQFTGVPSGVFDLAAHRPAYADTFLGQRRARQSGTPIRVAAGARVEASIAMPREAVLTGTVRMESGTPVAGAGVLVQQRVRENNRDGLVIAASASTDAQGRYRVSVPPGRHIVSLPPIGSSGTPAVYFPGVTQLLDAVPLDLRANEERSGVDFTVVPVRSSTITGTVEGTQGTVVQTTVVLLPEGGEDFLDSASARASGWQPGRFAFDNVPWGRYRLVAYGFGLVAGGRAERSQWGNAQVIVDRAGPIRVDLRLVPGVAVAGRVLSPAGSTGPQLTVQLQSPSLLIQGHMGSAWSGVVNPQGAFTIPSVPPGTYTASVTERTADGPRHHTDVLDFPVTVTSAAVSDLVITVPDAATALEGAVLSPSGQPAIDQSVVVFAADRRLWTPGARRTRVVRPDTSGQYRVSGLPAGDYLVTTADVIRDEVTAEVLAALQARATRVSLAHGKSRVQTLTAP